MNQLSERKFDLADKDNPEVDMFCRLVQSGIEAWTEAGKILCKALQRDPDVFTKITHRAPFMTNDILLAFKRIGERKLHPYLLLDNSPASRKMAMLPYDEQVESYGKPVRVAYKNPDGSFESFESPPQLLSNAVQLLQQLRQRKTKRRIRRRLR